MAFNPEFKISIITVVYNNAEGLENTIRSVILQEDKVYIQYLIVDGGSVDGSIDVIKKYESEIDFWVSEQDSGIYDAINRAIKKSSGHYFYVLNSGDILLKLPLNQLIKASQQSIDVAMFNVEESNGILFRSDANDKIKIYNTIHHQGAFYATSLNIQYDLSYKVFADYDVNQKLYKEGRKFERYDETISFHSLDGISQNKIYFNEMLKVIRSNYGSAWYLTSFIFFKAKAIKKKLRTLLLG